MYKVHVQNKDGTPLDPTTRFGHVRRLLKSGGAEVVMRKPFTIRLSEQIKNPVTYSYVGGTDPGRTNIGNTLVCIDTQEVVYTDKVETANEDVPAHMSKRKQARQMSRRGERLCRKRRAKKNGTLSSKLAEGRLIPGCEKPTAVKDIINTESRFMNRKRRGNMKDTVKSVSAWVIPTVKHLVQTHLNHVRQIASIYPVTDWTIEINRFSFMRMEDGTVRGVDFQNGRMKGYKNVEEYVYALQNGKCACCGKPIYDIHHIVPRHKHGSDGPDNRIGLCDECHHLVHTGELDIDKVGEKQKYAALSVLNQAIPFIVVGLEEMFGEDHVHTCFGHETKVTRELIGLSKDHDNDAVSIVAAATGIEPVISDPEVHSIKQYRRHDRARIKKQSERIYKIQTGVKKNGKPEMTTVAKNRRPREEQKGKALSQWFEEQVKLYGREEARAMLSRLKVTKSTRFYNVHPKNRIMPGATYLYKGKRYVLKGREANGYYFIPEGNTGRVPSAECKLLTNNTGLVYV